MPIDFGKFPYVPILGVRPAEMHALEELLPADKDAVLPYVVLQQWTTAHHFESVIAKVEAAIGHRPIIADITSHQYTGGTRRPIHDALDALRDSSRGYENWYKFIEKHENYIPSVQLEDPNQISRQVARIEALGRGGVVRLREEMFGVADGIASLFTALSDHSKVYFILDFQRQNKDILLRANAAISIAQTIRRLLPGSFFSVSASTFPDSFVEITEQEIFERRFHEMVVGQIGRTNAIYCDHASVRAERRGGGGGPPAPRIDYALAAKWQFFREADTRDKEQAYQIAAQKTIKSDDWLDLAIWGTDEIKRTASGHQNSIGSPARSTAARINIHLHQQRALGGGAAGPGADTKWTD